MPGEVSEIIKGVKECAAALDEITARTDAATLAGMRAAHIVAKRQVKSGMRGRPRWNHRGPIKGLPAVDLPQYPAHSARSGGPGKMTGSLSANVGYVKRPIKVGSTYEGGVGCGGRKAPITNLYRFDIESKYPYMRPGVDKAKPKIRDAFEAAWAKATEV